ncbi:MAG: hypothetical protein ACOC5S_05105 [Acidobacteriota bacterium]
MKEKTLRYPGHAELMRVFRESGFCSTEPIEIEDKDVIPVASRQVLHGLFTQKGICPPEFIGRTKGCYENMMSELKKRNIHLTETVVDGK